MPKFRMNPRWLLSALMLVGCVGLAGWGIDTRVARLLANTAWLVAGTGLLAIPLGTLLAVLLAKTNVMGRRWGWLLVAMMIFVPSYLVAGAWDAGFGVQGWYTLATNPRMAHEPWLVGWRGAVWVHAMAAVPWVALIGAAGLRTVEAELEEDAVLRMPAYRVLWHVTMRRAAAAIVVAGVWVAMLVSAEIAVSDLFQVRTFAEEVYTQAALGAFEFTTISESTSDADVDVGAALSIHSLWYGLGLSAVMVWIALWAGRRFFDDLVHAPQRRPWIWQLRGGRWPAAVALWVTLLVVAGVPLANLLYKAGVRVTATDAGREREWSAEKLLERVAAAPWEFRSELWQSGKLAALAATAALFVGAPLAWTMRRLRGLPSGRLAVLALLMVVPGPLLGIGVIRMLNQPTDSTLQALAWLYDTDFAPWLVQTLRALPLVTLVLWPTLSSVPQSMLDTAATDGAGWWRRFLWIAVPQRWPAIVAAWLVGFAIAVGELSGTVLVVPPGPTTISVRIFSLLHYGVDDRVASICLVFVLGLALVAAAVVPMVMRRTAAGQDGRDI